MPTTTWAGLSSPGCTWPAASRCTASTSEWTQETRNAVIAGKDDHLLASAALRHWRVKMGGLTLVVCRVLDRRRVPSPNVVLRGTSF
ncbi:hypothetical protein BaRGS_00024400 [Batillaria attramentaria]|uniref:Uncharacterized protein n=1 Tax=Batillaria attramentaria TaxID=370345 RepID=A0ABD0KBF6_9CAEN